jgi:hypothetical protein
MRSTPRSLAVVVLLLVGCSSADDNANPSDAPDADIDANGTSDSSIAVDGGMASPDAADASGDGYVDPNACEVFGAPGDCMDISTCAGLGDHTSYSGHCPGPTNIECCIKTPSTADNPPFPAGWQLMMQSEVTPEMTAWAVMILNDPITYPMFDSVTMAFGALTVLARVEWHPPDFNNSAIHRGVTLFERIDGG